VKSFYITTPIYYVTAKPHLGSLYSTLIADVLARYQRLCGRSTYFLTGTDEHGQKVAQAAAQAHMSPQEFVDSFIPAYTECWRRYGIDYDQFLRTTDTMHITGAQAFVALLQKKGYIYKATYEGWYCTPDETFVTEKDMSTTKDEKASSFTPDGVSNSAKATSDKTAAWAIAVGDGSTDRPTCPTCGRPTVWLSEDTYYFKLSAFQEKLLNFYKENPDFIVPKERQNEVIRFVEGGLKDLSISRTTVPWGVKFPNDDKHTIYVWVEALCNYITAVGYGTPAFNNPARRSLGEGGWPADVQVLGKDIVRFHAVYWPALLMAAELEIPKKLLVHGWITVDHQKMSKSLGNVVDPIALQEQYGADPVRYYLMKHMPITHDGNFSITDLEQTITADLANTLGNLFNRASVLAQTVSQGIVSVPTTFSTVAQKLRDAEAQCVADYRTHMDEGLLHLALQAVQTYLHSLNQYFHAQEPWKLAKTDRAAALEVLAVIAQGLHASALMLWPVMPQVMAQLLNALGVDTTGVSTLRLDSLVSNVPKKYVYAVIPPLFVKPEQVKPTEKKMENIEKSVNEVPSISIEDFVKVQLAVGEIMEAHAVEKSDKLIKLQVNFGVHGMRQILTGLRLHHTPESLVGLHAVFVLNLKPRMMMGFESHGMLLTAADANGVPQPLKPIVSVPNGTALK
jgi:methionyl-tRNA synthetase